MSATASTRPTTWLRIVGVLALLWNLTGVCFYLGSVGVLGPPFVQEGAPVTPAWVTAAYAIGVFAGAIGSLGLVLLRAWARPVLGLSLAALIVDWGWVFASFGAAAMPFGAFILAIAALLVWLATSAAGKGWLR